jgi:hypothetical protein
VRIIYVKVSTGKVGSACTGSFEVGDDETPEEIEELAREAMFELIEWHYTIDGQNPEI